DIAGQQDALFENDVTHSRYHTAARHAGPTADVESGRRILSVPLGVKPRIGPDKDPVANLYSVLAGESDRILQHAVHTESGKRATNHDGKGLIPQPDRQLVAFREYFSDQSLWHSVRSN